MKQIFIHKAEKISATPVEDVLISIDVELKDPGNILGRQEYYEKMFRADAKYIESILHQCLPQGTYDLLLAEMLSKKSSMMTIPYGEFHS